VYEGGEEPDSRFSFANERTFLAWIRTSLALLAAGVALDALELPIDDSTQHALALVMVVLGLLCAVASWTRWARAERAMRRSEPLPSSPFIALLTVGVLLVAVLLLVTGL
jgi:putative membrane protein